MLHRLIEQHETICVRAFNGALYTAPLDLRDFKAGDVLDVGTGSGKSIYEPVANMLNSCKRSRSLALGLEQSS